MRVMLRFTIPVEKGNQAYKDPRKNNGNDNEKTQTGGSILCADGW